MSKLSRAAIRAGLATSTEAPPEPAPGAVRSRAGTQLVLLVIMTLLGVVLHALMEHPAPAGHLLVGLLVWSAAMTLAFLVPWEPVGFALSVLLLALPVRVAPDFIPVVFPAWGVGAVASEHVQRLLRQRHAPG